MDCSGRIVQIDQVNAHPPVGGKLVVKVTDRLQDISPQTQTLDQGVSLAQHECARIRLVALGLLQNHISQTGSVEPSQVVCEQLVDLGDAVYLADDVDLIALSGQRNLVEMLRGVHARSHH